MSEEERPRSKAARIVCPKCGMQRAYRKTRKTFFQKQVMGYLGLYPWECGNCHHKFYSKHRGEARRDKVAENPWSPGSKETPAERG